MSDITMCKPSKECSLKSLCYRYLATPSQMQSYSDFSNGNKQECFWNYDEKPENRINDNS